MAKRNRHSAKSGITKSGKARSTLEIAELLVKTTYVIDVFANENDYEETKPTLSSGSGVAINSAGDLITAAHVIGKLEDLTGKEIIVARTEALPPIFHFYRAVLSGIFINMPLMRDPLKVDLAYLQPISPRENVPFLPVKQGFSPIGTTVLMSGFPNEVEQPLSFDSHIDYTLPAMTDPEHDTDRKRHLMKQLLMLKSGMIGYAKPASFNIGVDNPPFTLAEYYIDNSMNPGASGGAVVNMQGELVGTIIQRAETTTVFSMDPIPSGSTLAISSSAILDYLKNYTKFVPKL